MILAEGEGAGASAGPLGLLIVVLLGIATVLLVRNMNGRLKRLPPAFEVPASDPSLDPPIDPVAPGPVAPGPEDRPAGESAPGS